MPIKLPDRIETTNLVLRRPQPEDAQAIFDNWAQDTEVTRFLTWKPHTNIGQTREFITWSCQRAEDGERNPFIIESADSHSVIGMIDANPSNAHSVMLGYVLARNWWGQGLMAQAARALAELCLAEPEIWRVWAGCAPQNGQSARVMEKAGLVYEGCARRFVVLPNLSEQPHDLLIYARVKAES